MKLAIRTCHALMVGIALAGTTVLVARTARAEQNPPCEIPMSREQAFAIFRTLQLPTGSNFSDFGGADGGGSRAGTSTTPINSIMSEAGDGSFFVSLLVNNSFSFQVKSEVGSIQKERFSSLDVPTTVEYSFATGILRITAMGEKLTPVAVGLQASNVVASSFMKGEQLGDSLQLSVRDESNNEFGMTLKEALVSQKRKLIAQAVVPVGLQTLLTCDPANKHATVGAGVRFNFNLSFTAQATDITTVTESSKDENLNLSLENFLSGKRSSSAIRTVRVSKETFEGQTEVSASGKGVSTALVLDPNLINSSGPPAPGGRPRAFSAAFQHTADQLIRFQVVGQAISPILETQFNEIRFCPLSERFCTGGSGSRR